MYNEINIKKGVIRMNIGLKKKIISIAAVVAITATIGNGCVLAKSNDITVTYDGENISFDVQPEIVDDRVMVPMRTIFETSVQRLKWDSRHADDNSKEKVKDYTNDYRQQ